MWRITSTVKKQNGQNGSARGAIFNETYTRVTDRIDFLRGEFAALIGVSGSETVNATINIDAGISIKGYPMAVAGPDECETLIDGHAATRAICFKVLQGYITYNECDYVNDVGIVTNVSKFI